MPETKPPLPELEACASKLEASNDFKVLRRVLSPRRAKARGSKKLRYAMIVDTETTGLDLRTDEVIELGFILVAYQERKIEFIKDYGNEMRDPKRNISEEIQELTGITPEMVKGRTISKETVINALSLANIVIAHNAAFDRPVCERLFPEFKNKPWACSLKEIAWKEHGFESAKLKYLLLENGYFFDGHRALDDCAALVSLLSSASPTGGAFFEELVTNARTPSYLFKVQAPYELRQEMKGFGFRWSPYEERPGGEWTKTIAAKEFDFEKSRIDKIKESGARLYFIEQDAFTRYRLKD